MPAPGGLGGDRPDPDRLPVLRPGDLCVRYLGGGVYAPVPGGGLHRRPPGPVTREICSGWTGSFWTAPQMGGGPDFPGPDVEAGSILLPEAVLHRGAPDLCSPQWKASKGVKAPLPGTYAYRSDELPALRGQGGATVQPCRGPQGVPLQSLCMPLRDELAGKRACCKMTCFAARPFFGSTACGLMSPDF